METTGGRIRRFRETRKLTQRQLAAMCGMKPEQLQQYEYGTRNAKDEQLARIATALKIPDSILTPANTDSGQGIAAVIYDMFYHYEGVEIKEVDGQMCICLPKNKMANAANEALRSIKSILDSVTEDDIEAGYQKEHQYRMQEWHGEEVESPEDVAFSKRYIRWNLQNQKLLDELVKNPEFASLREYNYLLHEKHMKEEAEEQN